MTTSVRRSTGNQFVQLPRTSIARSAFDRSHGWKSTFSSGRLIPFFLDEVLPGDTFNVKCAMLVRMATPIYPIMDNVYLRTEFFFVPDRLLWNHFERFMGDQPDGPDQSTDFIVPMAKAPTGGYSYGSIADYFGLPTGVAGYSHSDLPLRALARIWNEWYRDENLQDAYNVDPTNGGLWVGDAPTSSSNSDAGYVTNPLLYSSEPPRRAKMHDYFTSALPWPQKGENVEISLGGSVPITLSSDVTSYSFSGTAVGSTGWYVGSMSNDSAGLALQAVGTSYQGVQPAGASVIPSSGVTVSNISSSASGSYFPFQADLSQATPITINDLRQAFQVQKFYERNARGGTRYTEILRSHFGVVSPDARLQRSEFLGAGRTRINITPVQQNSATDSTSPLGTLAAYGVGFDIQHGFTKSFVEHGFVIGFMSVQADLTYQQGLNRMWSRSSKLDFYWPVFAHLGEQAILNKEIYCQNNSVISDTTGQPVNDDVFGYQERYAEYRYFPSMITGKLRSTDAQSLDAWHLAQEFESLPTLNSDFIQENAPFSRVIAVPSEPEFIADVFFTEKCVRPMPVFGEPGLVDHF